MSCTVNKNTPDKIKYIQRYINTQVDINKNIPFGFTSSVNRKGESKIYTYGKRNIEKNLPFESDSIYRMASQSKFMSVVGFSKLISKNLIGWDTLLKDYIPEYSSDNMSVMDPYIPGPFKLLLNPLVTVIGSNTIKIKHKNNFKEGNTVSIEWSGGSLGNGQIELPAINGIPGFEVYNVFEIYNVDRDGYDINVFTEAGKTGKCGNYIKIRKLEEGVHRSVCLRPDTYLINPTVTTYYYKKIPLKRELTVLDVITHGLGWSYYGSSLLYMSFGYASNVTKRNIQAGIWNELGLPVGFPRSCYKCDINAWVRLAANVPLLFQPGEDWSYGPQISVLGSLIEKIDGRPVEKYMKDELWEPLDMNDTGFFIHDSDPLYLDKVDRVCQLYINMPKLVIKFIGKEIPFPPIYEVQTCMYEGPRKLAFMDAGMYTTVDDYVKFMKMLLNKDQKIIDKNMIDIISKYRTCHDVSNLSTVSSYSAGLSVSLPSSDSEIKRKRLLTSMRWGLGVGTIQGCKNNSSGVSDMIGITWAGVLGTRFLIDFCSGVGFNVGTNVIGPPAGTFDADLIELNYKTLSSNDYKFIISKLLL